MNPFFKHVNPERCRGLQELRSLTRLNEGSWKGRLERVSQRLQPCLTAPGGLASTTPKNVYHYDGMCWKNPVQRRKTLKIKARKRAGSPQPHRKQKLTGQANRGGRGSPGVRTGTGCGQTRPLPQHCEAPPASRPSGSSATPLSERACSGGAGV